MCRRKIATINPQMQLLDCPNLEPSQERKGKVRNGVSGNKFSDLVDVKISSTEWIITVTVRLLHIIDLLHCYSIALCAALQHILDQQVKLIWVALCWRFKWFYFYFWDYWKVAILRAVRKNLEDGSGSWPNVAEFLKRWQMFWIIITNWESCVLFLFKNQTNFKK